MLERLRPGEQLNFKVMNCMRYKNTHLTNDLLHYYVIS